MALNCVINTLTQPGTTGTVTYDLTPNLGLKAIVLIGVGMASDGDTTSSDVSAMSIGAGAIFNGPTSPDSWYFCLASESGDQAASHYANGTDNTRIMKLYGPELDTDPPDIDLEVKLVSFGKQGGSTEYDQFTLDWINLHTTASVKVFALLFYGTSDVQAHAGYRLGTVGGVPNSVQDVSVATGFGEAELIMTCFGNAIAGDNGGTDGDADPCLSIGWANKALEQMSSTFRANDGVTPMQLDYAQIFSLILGTNNSGVISTQGELDSSANWPTDGFRIIWRDSDGGMSDRFGFLAFTGSTIRSKIGVLTNPTGGGTPVSQNTALGIDGTFAMLWGGVLPSSASADTTHADLATYHIGAVDGTSQINIAWGEDDNNANNVARASMSQTKGIRMQTNNSGTLTLKAEADLSFSSGNLAQSWTTIDGTAREQCYMALGTPIIAPPETSFIIPFRQF